MFANNGDGGGRKNSEKRYSVSNKMATAREQTTRPKELMENVEELFGESHVAILFERRMKRIQQKYREQMAGQSFEERLDTLAKLQDADGYMVKLEQKADGVYSFIETNCPIARVASEFPQACQCEWSLFASLFNDAQVDRTECIAEGGTCCRYLLTKKQQT